MDVAHTKNKLRKSLVARRESLSAGEVEEKSSAIVKKVVDMVGWEKLQSIHVYSPLNVWNEVDTKELKEIIQQQWPHIKITSPPPRKDQNFPSEKFDLIIVPVLGFDGEKYRLGYGGGWYDRFLASQTQAHTIGLAYSFAEIDDLPHEPHDIPLQKIITEKEVLE